MSLKAVVATVIVSSATSIALASPASAEDQYGPEWDPGQDYSNFEPQPDQSNFNPQPDQTPFEPGYAPGTADVLDAFSGPGSLVGGLFGLLG